MVLRAEGSRCAPADCRLPNLAYTAQMSAMKPIWEEPAQGAFPGPIFLGWSGLEQIRSFIRGVSPRPPIHYLTGMRPTEASPGGATFTMPATPWLQAPPGSLYPGALAILADGPLGCAVQVGLPPMTPYATAEMSINYIRPTPADGRSLICRGRLIIAGKTLGLSDCIIEDDRGRVIATGTSRCFIFPPFGPAPDEPPKVESWVQPAYDTLPPYQRPVEGEVLTQQVWDSLSGLEIMKRLAAGDLPKPPCHFLTGLRPTEAEEGSCTFVLPASEWLCSPLGKLEGGTIAMLADSAIQGAVQTTVPSGTSYAPMDLKINFLRPVNPDNQDVTARAKVVHRGRTTAIATAELTGADGKNVAIATGSALILPDRPWQVSRPVEVTQEAEVASRA